ncbi:MAG: tail fiber protein [Candidatus Hydrogenedentales bacterium]|jgi:microcystin-dependent protein
MANNSPVTPADALANIPDSTSSLCSGFVKALLRGPTLFYQLVNWLLDADGNLNPVVLGTGTYEFSAVELPETGRFLCDGSFKSRTTEARLFAVISTMYGAGDGVNTFQLPDFRDRFPIGASATRPLASTGGEATHVLTLGELPDHGHRMFVAASDGSNAIVRAGLETTDETQGGAVTPAYVEATGDDPYCEHTGSDEAHNNMPPWLAAYIYIRS